MINLILFTVLLFCQDSAFARALNAYPGLTLQGLELVNEKPTGGKCYVVVQRVEANNTKGKHCFDVEAQFIFQSAAITKDPAILTSRVTNYHRPEYPTQKSCAESLDGKTSGDEIYGNDSNSIHIVLFC
ncbi:hypothetical protein [Bdellovibrio bacteriovorus]|uniref:hypothetical protein n=1 Tax=Bdellovibrio bacteriovorus TaxID=959 RepID=UPI0005A265F2|nr:hypothetical protein [Bdellovibrio bacteriovorus]